MRTDERHVGGVLSTRRQSQQQSAETQTALVLFDLLSRLLRQGDLDSLLGGYVEAGRQLLSMGDEVEATRVNFQQAAPERHALCN